MYSFRDWAVEFNFCIADLSWDKFVLSTLTNQKHVQIARGNMHWRHVERNLYEDENGCRHICNEGCTSWVFRGDGIKVCAISGKCRWGPGSLGGNVHLKRKRDSQNCFLHDDNPEDFRNSYQDFRRRKTEDKQLKQTSPATFTANGLRTNYQDYCFDEPTYGAGVLEQRHAEAMEI